MEFLDIVAGLCICLATAYVGYMMVRKFRKGGCGCGSGGCDKGATKSACASDGGATHGGATNAGCGCGCGGASGIQNAPETQSSQKDEQ